MTLAPGTRLGPYEILSSLGAGGMGEVYRAIDTRLGRHVALKLLPPEVANDPDRIQRFEHEARAVAALNHPNILALYDVGRQQLASGANAYFLVTELLEGQTLREVLHDSRLAIARAINIGIQAAEGMAAAHLDGIVHRDLKPENLFITSDGHVKILDFGIAKTTLAGDASQAPTQFTTAPHIVLGTASYMAPEQIRGHAVDHRADIFAFGIILYEMLTGNRPFAGQTDQDTMSAILRDPPARLSNSADRSFPPLLARVVERCLEKSVSSRFQSTRDLAFSLKSISLFTEGDSDELATHSNSEERRRPRVAWLRGPARSAALVLTALGGGALVFAGFPRNATRAVYRFVVTAPPDSEIVTEGQWTHFDVSPDGTQVAYAVKPKAGGPSTVYLRRFDQFDATELAAARGGLRPRFSPDGQRVAYLASNDRVNVISTEGGEATTLWRNTSLGSVWEPKDLPPFALSGPQIAFRIGAMPLDAGELARVHPQEVPGDKLLFTSLTLNSEPKVALADLGQNANVLADGMHPRHVAPGYLIFARGSTLMGARFDPTAGRLSHEAVTLLEGVRGDTTLGTSDFRLSDSGTLVYLAGAASRSSDARPLVWLDRKGGEETKLLLPDGRYASALIAPDGQGIAVTRHDDSSRTLWTGDLQRGTLTRFAAVAGTSYRWSDNGHRLTYRKQDGSHWSRPVDLSGPEEPLFPQQPLAAGVGPALSSPDGAVWVVNNFDQERDSNHTFIDIWYFRRPSSGSTAAAPEPWLQTEFVEAAQAISPDGRYLVYTSTSSGRNELYLRALTAQGAVHQVTRDGAVGPVIWRGEEILFRQLTGPNESYVMSVAVSLEPGIRLGIPERLFQVPRGYRWQDVSSDAKRFLFLKDPTPLPIAPTTQIHVVANWIAEAEARMKHRSRQ